MTRHIPPAAQSGKPQQSRDRKGAVYRRRKIVILERGTVKDLDRWAREGKDPNRSHAVQAAVNLLADRERRTRLARELSKLDRQEERKMAEEGIGDTSLPTF